MLINSSENKRARGTKLGIWRFLSAICCSTKPSQLNPKVAVESVNYPLSIHKSQILWADWIMTKNHKCPPPPFFTIKWFNENDDTGLVLLLQTQPGAGLDKPDDLG